MTAKKYISVLIAEDHAVVREAIRALLEVTGEFVVVAEAQTGLEAVALAAKLSPDVSIVDIAMPVLNGIDATRQIRAKNPGANVLVLSAHSDDEYIARATAVGATGFIEKQTPAEVLIKAIRTVAEGKPFFSAAIEKRMAASRLQGTDRHGLVKKGHARLTLRETEVLQLVAEGHANKQIAATLKISIKTVEKHRQSVMNKLNIHETAGLTRYAIRHRIIDCEVNVTIF
jgi:DNA-binding NarL/FixJ family response regulator